MAVQIGNSDDASVGAPEAQPDRPSTISVLHVLDSSGDTPVQWDRERLTIGDPEALAAVEEAERIFARARARGGQAFRVVRGQTAERLEHFDPQAEQILVIPQMVGG